MLRRLEQHLTGMLKIGKKEGAQSKPGEKQKAVQKEPEKKLATTTQPAAPKTSEKVEGGGDEEAEFSGDEGDDNPLAAAIRAKKKGLKPTEVSQQAGFPPRIHRLTPSCCRHKLFASQAY